MREQENPRERIRPGHHGEIDNRLWEDQMDFGCPINENVRAGEFERQTVYSQISLYEDDQDEMLREKAIEALYRDDEVDAVKIHVEVRAGCIYLQGMVSSRDEKKAAERCVEKVEGVKDIFNELKLQRLN